MIDILSFARQIIDMHERIMYLECENERLREIEQKYDTLLVSSVQHGKTMTGKLFKLSMQLAEKKEQNV
jgi:hypothetical protein